MLPLSPKGIFFQFFKFKDSFKDTDQKPLETSIKKHSAAAKHEEKEKNNCSKTEILRLTSEADIDCKNICKKTANLEQKTLQLTP